MQTHFYQQLSSSSSSSLFAFYKTAHDSNVSTTVIRRKAV